MAEIKLGNKEAAEKLTAKIFFQESGTSGYRNLGNVADYSHVPDVTHVTHYRADKGWSYVNDEQVDSITWRFEATLDSFDEQIEQLVNLASQQSDNTQSSSTSESVTFSSVELGKRYFIGDVDLSNVTVQVGTTTHTEGTDYEIDTGSGMLTVIDGGAISAGDDVDVTYDRAQVITEQFTGLDKVLFEGSVYIFEFNQFDKKPLRRHSGSARLNITAWPEQSGEFGQATLQLTFTSLPTVRKRHAA